MLVVDYNSSIVLNDGMFNVQNPVTAPDRGTDVFDKVIEASGLDVVHISSEKKRKNCKSRLQYMMLQVHVLVAYSLYGRQ